MNFIEAHQIVNQYIDAIVAHTTGICYAYSELPFYEKDWKEKLVNASQLYLAYTVLWRIWTQQQVENYFSLLRSVRYFRPDVEATAVNEASNILDKYQKNSFLRKLNAEKIKRANKIFEQHANETSSGFEESRRILREVEKVFNHMIEYRKSVYDVQVDQGKKKLESIREYCKEAYRVAGMQYNEEDVYYFLPFETMRRFLGEPKLKHYYEKYKDYLYLYE